MTQQQMKLDQFSPQ